MSIKNGYVTLDELKAHLLSNSQPAVFTAEAERNMETAIEAVSRLWDATLKTNFYGATETRYFTPEWSDLMYVDDLISVTTFKTDDDEDGVYETTWATTDYWLEPKNARVKPNDRDKRPYRQIRIRKAGDYTFPTKVEYGVEIAGVWGYTNGIQSGVPTEVPSVVKQGVLLMANRVYRRKDAIFGVAGTPALGVQIIQARIQQDSDIMALMNGVDARGF
jgi:hypothetical protein